MSSKELHEINSSKHKRKSSVITAVIFLSILVLCFFLTAFTIQDPPPGEQYVAVGFADLGEVEDAGGETETEIPSEAVEEVVEETESVESVVEPVVLFELLTLLSVDELLSFTVGVISISPPQPASVIAVAIRLTLNKSDNLWKPGFSKKI